MIVNKLDFTQYKTPTGHTCTMRGEYGKSLTTDKEIRAKSMPSAMKLY